MDNKILGLDSNMVYAAIIVIMLIILGVITFHYYAFVSAGKNATFNAGAGAGFTLLPTKNEGFCEKSPQLFRTVCDKTCQNYPAGQLCKRMSNPTQ